MTVFSLFLFVLFAALAWLWYDGLGARESAVQAARHACESEGLQFLDDTVAGAGIRLRRTEQGHAALYRVFHFEYSDTGNNRRPGSVELLGQRVLMVNIGLRLVPSDVTRH